MFENCAQSVGLMVRPFSSPNSNSAPASDASSASPVASMNMRPVTRLSPIEVAASTAPIRPLPTSASQTLAPNTNRIPASSAFSSSSRFRISGLIACQDSCHGSTFMRRHISRLISSKIPPYTMRSPFEVGANIGTRPAVPRPPNMVDCSSTSTFEPCRAAASAAAKPEGPPPTTTISASARSGSCNV